MRKMIRKDVLVLCFIVLLIFLFGCITDVQRYQKQISTPKPVEHIGPKIEQKPYELIMPKEKVPLPVRATLEVTQQDIFAQKTWDPTKVSVLNITLGDSLDLVLSVLGKPDEVVHHPTMDIVNLGYGHSFGLETTGLVFYVVNNSVTKITIKQDFNPFLHGETVINYTKEEIYKHFGLPDEQKDLANFRVFKYKKGLEVIHSGKKMKAFVLTYPKLSEGVQDTSG